MSIDALTWCTIFPKGPSKDVGAVATEIIGIGWDPAPPTCRSHHFKAALLTRKQKLKREAVLSSRQISYRDKKEGANQRKSIVATVPDQK